uniref:Uncharacterized protein n=1 Tax=Terrapene triunguis TaxID=2587831 RepID=A0A674JVA3_9SAUR
ENECKKHMAFVPGHSLIGEGIDVTTMGRKGAYLVDSSLWQHEDGTCTLCRNPLQGEQLQRLPLATVDWRVHVSCRRKLSSSVHQSAMAMMASAASVVQNDWEVGLDVPVKPKVNVQVALAGSHSKLASFLVDHTRMDKYSFMSHAKAPAPTWSRTALGGVLVLCVRTARQPAVARVGAVCQNYQAAGSIPSTVVRFSRQGGCFE